MDIFIQISRYTKYVEVEERDVEEEVDGDGDTVVPGDFPRETVVPRVNPNSTPSDPRCVTPPKSLSEILY